MFMGTLQGTYLDKMVKSASSSFSDLVVAGHKTENVSRVKRSKMMLL